VNEQLLGLADDELVIGWRDSEWTGIAPVLEEDVAFSSIAQNEIGHARAVYELLISRSDAGGAGVSAPGRAPSSLRTASGRAPSSLRTHDADALAFDRAPADYRCAPLVELRLLDWAHTIARRWLYEVADEIRIAALKQDADPSVAGLAAKIDREEAYHRMHAEMWRERLQNEPRFSDAVDELWPYAVGMLPASQRDALAAQLSRDLPSDNVLLGRERGAHTDELAELLDEMTMVRRSAPAGASW
jgi:ring-1,2-phenylacetyl-CoA epoxidase subunit PaaC